MCSSEDPEQPEINEFRKKKKRSLWLLCGKRTEKGKRSCRETYKETDKNLGETSMATVGVVRSSLTPGNINRSCTDILLIDREEE